MKTRSFISSLGSKAENSHSTPLPSRQTWRKIRALLVSWLHWEKVQTSLAVQLSRIILHTNTAYFFLHKFFPVSLKDQDKAKEERQPKFRLKREVISNYTKVYDCSMYSNSSNLFSAIATSNLGDFHHILQEIPSQFNRSYCQGSLSLSLNAPILILSHYSQL